MRWHSMQIRIGVKMAKRFPLMHLCRMKNSQKQSRGMLRIILIVWWADRVAHLLFDQTLIIYDTTSIT